MKVYVYKMPEGKASVMVDPSPGNGKAPVVLQGVTEANVVDAVLPVVKAARGRRERSPFQARLGYELDGASTPQTDENGLGEV